MPDHTTRQPSEVKTCSKCGETKTLDEYSRNASKRGGREGQCKACRAEENRAWREANRAWYIANRERRAETARVWRQANRERAAEYGRAWRAANRERKAETDRAWAEANPEKVAQYYARSRAKYPDRYAARNAVNHAVERGKFPPAWTMVCEHCQEAQAAHWHHYLGYATEHKLDVIAVCTECHGREHQVDDA